MDEVFGEDCHVADIVVLKTSSQTPGHLAGIADYVLLYARDKDQFEVPTIERSKGTWWEG